MVAGSGGRTSGCGDGGYAAVVGVAAPTGDPLVDNHVRGRPVPHHRSSGGGGGSCGERPPLPGGGGGGGGGGGAPVTRAGMAPVLAALAARMGRALRSVRPPTGLRGLPLASLSRPARVSLTVGFALYASLLLTATYRSLAGGASSAVGDVGALPLLPPLDAETRRFCSTRALQPPVGGGRISPTAASIKAQYECGCRQPDVYEAGENPRVAVVVQSFNHVRNIDALAGALRAATAIEEVIVCEDGSTDGSLEVWTKALQGVSHFVVTSNDLHEVRCYNRALRMTSADFVVLLQDDDLPPASSNWVMAGTTLFDADPDLDVLSGFIGQLWDPSGVGAEYGESQSDHGGLRRGPTQRIPTISPATGAPFMYTECGWAAPLWIRSSAVRRTGGLDVDLFAPGQPGVWQDCVLSYAAWAAGGRVGVYDAGFRRGVGGHGTTRGTGGAERRAAVWLKARTAVDARYDRLHVRELAVDLNSRLLLPRYAGGGGGNGTVGGQV
ncbi:hypothetical protein MMPV_001684 [Pyropia vietnamensis]